MHALVDRQIGRPAGKTHSRGVLFVLLSHARLQQVYNPNPGLSIQILGAFVNLKNMAWCTRSGQN